MPITKKEKLERFDAVLAERDLLRLAIHDLRVNCRFTPTHTVTVDCSKELDEQYKLRFRVSISQRAMPYFMVEEFGLNSREIIGVSFVTEEEMEAQRENPYIFWRMMRHATWKIDQKRLAA